MKIYQYIGIFCRHENRDGVLPLAKVTRTVRHKDGDQQYLVGMSPLNGISEIHAYESPAELEKALSDLERNIDMKMYAGVWDPTRQIQEPGPIILSRHQIKYHAQ